MSGRPHIGMSGRVLSTVAVPVAERHAGQDDELLEPDGDPRMGIGDRSEIPFANTWPWARTTARNAAMSGRIAWPRRAPVR